MDLLPRLAGRSAFFEIAHVSETGTCSPSRSGAASPLNITAADDADEPFFTHFCDRKAMANITVSPGHAGPVEIAVQLEDGDERPLATAQGVTTVTLANPDKGVR